MTFEDTLAYGQLGESKIARYLRARGNSVLPAYEKEINNHKGPRLFTPAGPLVTPDLLVFPAVEFVEAKHKTVFTWHRISKQWTTGIDLHHYEQYQQVQYILERRIWLLFLHECSTPRRGDIEQGCPPSCPTGLFAQSLTRLCESENHRHENWGRHGMVYWAVNVLRLIAALEEIEAAA